MNLCLPASRRMHTPLPGSALSPMEVLTVAFNPKGLTGSCGKTSLTGRWISSVSTYSFAFQFSTPSSAVTTERLCWSGLMLLEMVWRPITHFTAAAKELSDVVLMATGQIWSCDLKAHVLHIPLKVAWATQWPPWCPSTLFWLLSHAALREQKL